MTTKKFFSTLFLSSFLFSVAAQAGNIYLELYNDNQTNGGWDVIQFRICDYHNGSNCVYGKELSAQVGENHETFKAPSYKSYSIEIRDVTKNMTHYQSCSALIPPTTAEDLHFYVFGTSDGKSINCLIFY